MILMNHIVPHCQLGKALDFLPFIGGFLPLPPRLFQAKHIPLGDNHKLNLRVFKASVKVSVGHQDLSRLHLLFFVLRGKRA